MIRTATRVAAAALLVTTGLSVAACSLGDTASPQPATTSSTTSATSSAVQDSDDGATDLATLGPVAALDPADVVAAQQQAAGFMQSFAAHDVPEDHWWANVAPYLTPAAAQDYSYTDPATIAVATVNGEDSSVEAGAPSPLLVKVDVPTDVGTYVLTMTRLGSGDPWLVDRADSPTGAP